MLRKLKNIIQSYSTLIPEARKREYFVFVGYSEIEGEANMGISVTHNMVEVIEGISKKTSGDPTNIYDESLLYEEKKCGNVHLLVDSNFLAHPAMEGKPWEEYLKAIGYSKNDDAR